MSPIVLSWFSPFLRQYLTTLGSIPDLLTEVSRSPKNIEAVLVTSTRIIRQRLAQFYRILQRVDCSQLNHDEKETLKWFVENRSLVGGSVHILCEDLRASHRSLDGKNLVALIQLLDSYLKSVHYRLSEQKLIQTLKEFTQSHSLETDEAQSVPFLIRHLLLLRILVLSEAYLAILQAQKQQPFGPLLFQVKLVIETLRKFGDTDWETLVSDSSKADQLLAHDPAGIYTEMTAATRTAYKKRLRFLSRMGGVSEYRLAERALVYAQAAEIEYQRHVGYWLMDVGHERLLADLPTTQYRFFYLLTNWMRSRYVLVLACMTALLAGLVSSFFPFPYSVLIFFLALFPALRQAKQLLNSLIKSVVAPSFLPALEVKKDLTEKEATMFVIPAFFSSEKTLIHLLSKLEAAYLGNQGKHIYFGLLLDFPDVSSAPGAREKNLKEQAKKSIARLNERYGEKNAFFLFFRESVLNEQEGVYMGWERKRGKLLEFMQALRGQGTKSSYELFPFVQERMEFVVVVDEDAHVPREFVTRLIAIHAHPQNRPLLHTPGQPPIHGSTFVQPHVALWFAERSNVLPRLFGKDALQGNYSMQVSDTYQDLFGKGNFIGKGSIHIDAFLSTLRTFFPENQILSHDLLEGMVGGTTFANEVVLYDEFPLSLSSYLGRMHRWIRGDWQTIPWLSSTARRANGARRRNPLGGLERFKIIDNLVQSLVPAATLGILVIALVLSQSHLLWIAILVLAIDLFAVIDHVFQCIYLIESFFVIDAEEIPARLGKFALQLVKLVRRSFFEFGLFPYVAGTALDAIFRSLYRQGVSRKYLLEWNTAAAAEQNGTWRKSLHAFLPGFEIILFSGLILFFAGLPVVWIGLGASFFLFFPFLIRTFIRTKQAVPKLTKQDKALLRETSQRTWEYYAEFVNKKTLFLPPDYVQEFPTYKITQATSISNIGFYLLSILCAAKLEFITSMVARKRVEETIQTLENLPRYKNHFYNWYSLKTGKPTEGGFISSVDAGNLLACFMAVSSWLLNEARTSSQERNEFSQLYIRTETLIQKMDFQKMVSRRKLLLSVGFDPHKNLMNASFYQTLASESRLSVLLMLAKRDLPLRAWNALSRITRRQPVGGPAILSWSGTLFEYLMPAIFIEEPTNSIMDTSSRSAYVNQRAFLQVHGLRGALSESGFVDANPRGAYGYKAFGIPTLASSPEVDAKLVVSPYAVALGLSVEPVSALADLCALSSNAYGRYGFYEAIDYSADPKGQIVGTYMSHHQGMLLASIVNFLHAGFIQKLFMSHPLIQSVLFLIDEAIPSPTKELF